MDSEGWDDLIYDSDSECEDEERLSAVRHKLKQLAAEIHKLTERKKELEDLEDKLKNRMNPEKRTDTQPQLKATRADPAFITFLLTEDMCDWFFLVGNPKLGETKKIGVVKKMLLAHSPAMRSSMIEGIKVIEEPHAHPETFRNFMRFVYGHDITESLTFDEADDLFYMAEQYLVEPLKTRLSARLIKLLSPDNVCSLLNNPACRSHLELNSAISHILQYETDRVISSAQWLDLSCDALVTVVEQEALNVPEIEVWKAAVRWARHHAGTVSGEALRRKLGRLMKHIHLCTLDRNTFCKEIVPTGILTASEVTMVCLAMDKGEVQEGLVSISNRIACRALRPPLARIITLHLPTARIKDCCSLFINTKDHAVELLPLTCTGLPTTISDGRLTYDCKCVITIIDYSNNTLETIEVSRQMQFGQEFTVPFTRRGKNTVLQANTQYMVELTFEGGVTMNGFYDNSTYKNEHLRVNIANIASYDSSHYRMPVRSLHYRPLLQ